MHLLYYDSSGVDGDAFESSRVLLVFSLEFLCRPMVAGYAGDIRKLLRVPGSQPFPKFDLFFKIWDLFWLFFLSVWMTYSMRKPTSKPHSIHTQWCVWGGGV